MAEMIIKSKNKTKSGKSIGIVHHIGEHDDYGSIKGDDATNKKYAAKASDNDYGKYQEWGYRVVSASDGSALLFKTNLKTGKTTSEYWDDAKAAKKYASSLRNDEKKAAIERMGKDDPDAKKAWDDRKEAQQKAMQKGRHGKELRTPDGRKVILVSKDDPKPSHSQSHTDNKTKSNTEAKRDVDNNKKPTKSFKSLAEKSQVDIAKLKKERKARGKSTSLSAMSKDGDIKWITVDGRHIPLRVD